MSVIVTGAALGIGRATTDLILASGRRVVAVDRDVSPLSAIADHPMLAVVEGDVTDPSTIDRACEVAEGVTGLVASAGISRPAPSAGYSMAQWSELLDINLTAVFLAMRAAAANAVEGASLVAISSITGMQGFSGRAAYAASKAGVDGLVRSLAVEYASRIRVNAVAPGYIMTDIVRRNLELGAIDEKTILSRTPLGRWGEPADVAQAIDFLLSEKSSWITGVTLPVDGGWMSYGGGLGSHD